MSAQILALVGSLRASSYNRQLAEAAAKLAPEGSAVDIVECLADVLYYTRTSTGPPPSRPRPRRGAVRCGSPMRC